MSSKEVGAIGSLGLRDSSQGLDTLYNQDVQSTNLAYENRIALRRRGICSG